MVRRKFARILVRKTNRIIFKDTFDLITLNYRKVYQMIGLSSKHYKIGDLALVIRVISLLFHLFIQQFPENLKHMLKF